MAATKQRRGVAVCETRLAGRLERAGGAGGRDRRQPARHGSVALSRTATARQHSTHTQSAPLSHPSPRTLTSFVCYARVSPSQMVGVALLDAANSRLHIAEFGDDSQLSTLESVIVQHGPRSCVCPQDKKANSKRHSSLSRSAQMARGTDRCWRADAHMRPPCCVCNGCDR